MRLAPFQKAGSFEDPDLAASHQLLRSASLRSDNVLGATSERRKTPLSQPAWDSSQLQGNLLDTSIRRSHAPAGQSLQIQELARSATGEPPQLLEHKISPAQKSLTNPNPLSGMSLVSTPRSLHDAAYPHPDLFTSQDRNATRRLKDMTRILERAKELYVSVQAQLADLRESQANIEEQIMTEKTTFAKRHAYLQACRMAAEREEKLMSLKVSDANLLLAAAKERRATAAATRLIGLKDLNAMTSPHSHTSGQSWLKDDDGTITTVQSCSKKVPKENASEPVICFENTKLELSAHQSSSLPTSVSASTATFTVLPTPPYSPESWPDIYFPESHRPVEGARDNATHGHASVTKQPFISSNASADHQGVTNLPPLSSTEISCFPKDCTGATCESPIGPYVRPPMLVQDMQRCIRCLLGKDKSLKTGNHARAFLGLPWSKIVSFDPDTLLSRGVSGIKEGSTGMASRLRMMTIIESVLSNQNNDAIGADVWERPTFFCESCRQRYPITVDTDKCTIPFDECTEVRPCDPAASTAAHINASGSQPHRETNKADSQETSLSTPRKKRSRNKLRGSKLTLTHATKPN